MNWQYTGRKRPDFAIELSTGQESVWDYPRPPVIEPETRQVKVVSCGRILADTKDAPGVLETASPPGIYPPRMMSISNTWYLQVVLGTANGKGEHFTGHSE